MNWDDLKLFLAVAREGSISGGARLLGVQHSTVSRRLRALETGLGVRLIDRKKSGYELTVAGEALKLAACKMEHEVLEIDSTLVGKDAIRLTGKLRITAINNMASTVLMPMFSSFSKRYPDVDLHIMVSNKYASLAEREADIAIRLTNTPMETLIGKRLITVASTVYGGREYLARLSAAGGELQWLGVECCDFHQSWTKNTCGGDYCHNFFVDDTLLTISALREGLGVAYLPCFMGDTDPVLQRYCPPDPNLELGLWLLFHPDLKRTARVLAFRDHMTEVVEAQRDLFEGGRPLAPEQVN